MTNIENILNKLKTSFEFTSETKKLYAASTLSNLTSLTLVSSLYAIQENPLQNTKLIEAGSDIVLYGHL